MTLSGHRWWRDVRSGFRSSSLAGEGKPAAIGFEARSRLPRSAGTSLHRRRSKPDACGSKSNELNAARQRLIAQSVALAPNLNRRASRGPVTIPIAFYRRAALRRDPFQEVIAALKDWPVTGLLSPLKSIVRLLLFEMRPLHVCFPLIALLSTLALAEAQALACRLALVGETYLCPPAAASGRKRRQAQRGLRARDHRRRCASAESRRERRATGAAAPSAHLRAAQVATLELPVSIA